jgi:hypothetical protein
MAWQLDGASLMSREFKTALLARVWLRRLSRNDAQPGHLQLRFVNKGGSYNDQQNEEADDAGSGTPVFPIRHQQSGNWSGG